MSDQVPGVCGAQIGGQGRRWRCGRPLGHGGDHRGDGRSWESNHTRVMEAVCKAAGWPYCEDHDRRASKCAHLHPQPPPKHYYLCDYPERECSCHRFGHTPPPLDSDAACEHGYANPANCNTCAPMAHGTVQMADRGCRCDPCERVLNRAIRHVTARGQTAQSDDSLSPPRDAG